MTDNPLLNLARDTTVWKIGEASLVHTEHADRYPTIMFTLSLQGDSDNLLAAKTLIVKAAKDAFMKVQITMNKPLFGQSPGMDVFYEGSVTNGAVNLLSLVHKATQCDIGAKIYTCIDKVDSSPSDRQNNYYRLPENRVGRHHYIPGIIVDCSDIEHNDMLRPYVIDYLARELKTLPDTFEGKEPIKWDPKHKNDSPDAPKHTQIYQYTNRRLTNEPAAEVCARMLAEHAAGTLGIPDASVEFDRRGYAEERGMC